jgi:hypothetical protein
MRLRASSGSTRPAGILLPEDKVRVVRDLVDAGSRVVMLGDGTNDAPALSTASVGVALASGGGGITAEAARRCHSGATIHAASSRRSNSAGARRVIAKQSVLAGLGLSSLAMLAAAAGFIPPTAGALLQEGIDVAVILNALRAAVQGAVASDPFLELSAMARSTAAPGRHTKSGTVAERSSLSATLPSRKRVAPPYPWVARAMRSAPWRSAQVEIAATVSVVTSTVVSTRTPRARSGLATSSRYRVDSCSRTDVTGVCSGMIITAGYGSCTGGGTTTPLGTG